MHRMDAIFSFICPTRLIYSFTARLSAYLASARSHAYDIGTDMLY